MAAIAAFRNLFRLSRGPDGPGSRLWLKAAILVMLTVAAAGAFIIRSWYVPLANLETPVEIRVEQGSSLSRVSRELAEAGHLQQPRLFVLLARLHGVSDAIQAGEYRLEPGITPLQLLRRMVAGDTINYRVTLLEGWTFQQALEALWSSPKLEKALQGMSDRQLTARLTHILDLGIGDGADMSDSHARGMLSPEGLIFPDTYFFSAGTSDIEILNRAHARLQSVLAEDWQRRRPSLPLKDPYEALILASIIEKETGLAAERRAIAGVFIRRLELDMRLQSDPTVLYGKTAAFEGDLTRRDLEAATPYNTYRITGLPPTPIALAGRESLQAALNPESTPYLYFVSRGDGSHVFSATLAEHNAAVNRYQRGRGASGAPNQ